MATFTQHRQPYGRLTRRTYVVDGIAYAVRLVGASPLRGHLERWELRRYPDPERGGSVRDAYCDLPKGTALDEAAERLGVA